MNILLLYDTLARLVCDMNTFTENDNYGSLRIQIFKYKENKRCVLYYMHKASYFEFQIRRGIEDNSEIILLISQ